MAFERSKKNSSTKNKRYKNLVNTTTPYENLIAAKLDQIPVPDMADSIWNSIEMQLDADAVDQTPDKKTPPKNTGKGWYGTIGIIIVATALWWYYHDGDNIPQQTTPLKTLPATEHLLPVTDSHTIINNKTEEKKGRILPVIVPKDSFSLNNILPINIPVDSVATQQETPVPVDSSALQRDKAPVRVLDSIYTFPVRKKYKGVKGITQDDYRLSVNPDSTHKK
jgi:hypothetical protein